MGSICLINENMNAQKFTNKLFQFQLKFSAGDCFPKAIDHLDFNRIYIPCHVTNVCKMWFRDNYIFVLKNAGIREQTLMKLKIYGVD